MRLLIFLVVAGCHVPLGNTPDAAPCTPSTRFFVTDVWPSYIGHNQCATSGCHAFEDGHGYLRYQPIGLTSPDPMSALADWSQAWRDNYYQSIQLVNCGAPLTSRLLSVPEGNADPHPPGIDVDMPAVAEQLFQDWVSAP